LCTIRKGELLAYDKEGTGEVVGPRVGMDPTLKVPVAAKNATAHQVTLKK
jgi:hypothetical protein